jgi:REP element-mobilizing transposase RayT
VVHASHVIFGAYGFWLPNDPRGSWSEWVGSWELFRAAGRASTTNSRRSVAAMSHNQIARLNAKENLSYPAVTFDERQRSVIANGFGRFSAKNGLPILACAVLREHVHLVIARHRYKVEQAVVLLKGAASSALVEQRAHPLAKFAMPGERSPKCWARGEWKVFLETETNIERAIRYVEANPEKEGLPRQCWSFVERAPLSSRG